VLIDAPQAFGPRVSNAVYMSHSSPPRLLLSVGSTVVSLMPLAFCQIPRDPIAQSWLGTQQSQQSELWCELLTTEVSERLILVPHDEPTTPRVLVLSDHIMGGTADVLDVLALRGDAACWRCAPSSAVAGQSATSTSRAAPSCLMDVSLSRAGRCAMMGRARCSVGGIMTTACRSTGFAGSTSVPACTASGFLGNRRSSNVLPRHCRRALSHPGLRPTRAVVCALTKRSCSTSSLA
jgi:hypothetical protein